MGGNLRYLCGKTDGIYLYTEDLDENKIYTLYAFLFYGESAERVTHWLYICVT